MVKQDGLEWVSETFGLEPRWTLEPEVEKIELIARKSLELGSEASCQVIFHTQGAFNKLYKVETETGDFLMRITLPVDPSKKTNSEVATINFVRQITDIPVPKIFAFDDSCENELGFEWILMEILPGETLRRRWRKFSMKTKKCLIEQILKFQIQLFHHRFDSIGNIFIPLTSVATSADESITGVSIPPEHLNKLADASQAPTTMLDNLSLDLVSGTKDPTADHIVSDVHTSTVGEIIETTTQAKQVSPVLGQIVSLMFFWGDHINQDVARGPFTRSEDWLKARLSLVLTDQEKILNSTDDEDDIEEAETAKEVTQRLLQLLPTLFPSEDRRPEVSVLFHHDLSMQNILVDDDGKITGIVDWECVSTLPLWKVCELPQFLQWRDRYEEPNRDTYGLKESDDVDESDNNGLDDEGIDTLYWEHLEEYELTVLRSYFIEEMRLLEPKWVQIMEGEADKNDFELAVQSCDNCWSNGTVARWLDARERGERQSLREAMFERGKWNTTVF